MTEHHEFVAEIIDSSAKALAEWAVALQEERSPDLRDAFGDAGMLDLRADTLVRVRHLANAVAFDEPAILQSHLAWTRACFESRAVGFEPIEQNLACLREVTVERLPSSARPVVERQFDAAARALHAEPAAIPSHVEGDAEHQPLARRYLLAILEGDRAGARVLLDDATARGISVTDIIEHVITPAHAEIGRMWQIGEIGVADEHLASASSEWVVSHLLLNAPKPEPRGRIMVASSVGGDTHSFGVRLVADAFEIDGWRTFFLGASTPLVDLVGAVIERQADLLALSANLGCHLREMKRVIDALRSQPETARVAILVGGGAVNIAPELWRKLGADSGAPTAREAVAEGNRLVAQRGSPA